MTDEQRKLVEGVRDKLLFNADSHAHAAQRFQDQADGKVRTWHSSPSLQADANNEREHAAREQAKADAITALLVLLPLPSPPQEPR